MKGRGEGSTEKPLSSFLQFLVVRLTTENTQKYLFKSITPRFHLFDRWSKGVPLQHDPEVDNELVRSDQMNREVSEYKGNGEERARG